MRLIRVLLKNDCTISVMEREKGVAIGNQWFAWDFLGFRLICTSCLLFFMLIFSSLVYAQSFSPKAAQWKSVGGRIVASGTHKFKSSDPASGIMKGAFTVRGTGYIGVIYREFKSVCPSVVLRESSGRVFISRHLGSQQLLKGADGNWKWYPASMITEDYIPNANKGGWVPAPTMDNPTTTLQVWVGVEGGGIQNDERAIQYEFWFFPLEGGQVIATANPGQPDIPPANNQDKNTVRLGPVADNHVYAYAYRGWNRANWGKYENLGAGCNPTGGEKRTFLRFDLTGIAPNSVNKATLKLYHVHTGGGNAVDLGVYRVMSPWGEGSGTYHSGQTEQAASSGESSWVNQPGIDRYPVVYFNPGQGVNKWVEVDVTSLIKAWLTGVPNHGMVIKGGEHLSGKPESQYGFRSREFEEIDKRPQLVLSGAGGQHEPQVALNNDVIIDKNNSRPWVIGNTNGIHVGTGSAWAEQPGGGRGKDIAIDGSGRPWVIGTDNGIYYHDGNRWIQYPGGGKGFAIDVSADGTPWVIGTDYGIYYHDGNRWVQYPGGGKGFDINVSSNGTPWVIGMDHGIHYHDGNRWVQYPGGGRGSRIAISPNGTPWVIGSDSRIHYGTGSGWAQQPGEMLAKDIAIDGSGRPWVISRDNRIHYHDRGRWIEYPGNGRGLAIAISKYEKLETADSPLMNGSFEKPSVAGSTHKNFGVGQHLAGWKVVKGAVDLVGSYFRSSDGNQCVDLHGSPGFGGIEQTFRTEPRKKYKVTFDLAGNPHGEPWIKKVRVSAAGDSKDYEFDCRGRTSQQLGWTTKTFYFTATSISTTLTFATLHNTGGSGLYGPVIDNVRVYRTGNQSSGQQTTGYFSISGQWLADQSNGYNGTLNLQQSQRGKFTGHAIWNGYLKGTVNGEILGNAVTFTISYPNGDKGLYQGTLAKNGIRIINGTTKGNNGATATWEASR